MTKVDFYILANDSVAQRHIFACRLTEKAFKLGHQVYLHCDDNAQAHALDQLLWSWRSSSFVPHIVEQSPKASVEGEGTATEDRVQIGFGQGQGSAASHHGLLINLSQSVPEFFSRFERVSEIVIQHDDITALTRANFRFYRERGYPLQSHDLRPQSH